MNQNKTDILIIGLGLAGMITAITAAKSGKKITIITKTKSLMQIMAEDFTVLGEYKNALL